MPLVADISMLPPEIRLKMREVLANEFTYEAQMAKIRQQKIAQFYAQNRPRSIDGLGEQMLAIDPFILNYFGKHHRVDPHSDHDFRDWVRKRCDWARVNSTGTKLQVGYTGVSGSATTKRYSRTFTDSRFTKPGGAPATQSLQTLKA